jgi:hypothetical protein
LVNDIFGVRKIYPDKTGSDGHSWFLNSSGSNIHGESARKGSDSEGTYYTINSNQVRASAETELGYDEGDLELDHGKLDLNNGGRGHMMEKGGFRDLEMTGYFMGTKSGSDDDCEYVLYCRGGEHHDSDRGCEGSAYKAAVNYNNGECRVRKEQWHVAYVNQNWRQGHGGSVRNKWTGMKFVVVNRGQPENVVVYMEIWIDKRNDNNWERVYTFTDDGGWGGGGGHCGGDKDQILTWSGPLATFRWDIEDVRFKNLSVREIKESGSFEPPPPGGGGPSPPPPGEDPWQRLDYPPEGVSATGFDEGNVPSNVGDQNLDTVWFYRNLPAFIKIDLGGRRAVGYIKIAWFHGSTRTMTFTIHTSEDNVTFTEVFNGSSAGNTEDFERYDFTDINARFVMINVLTNSERVAASIKEIQIYGDITPIGEEPTPSPPPIPHDPLYLYVQRKHVYHVNYDDGPQCP